MSMENGDGIQVVYANDRQAWRQWLEQQGRKEKAVWLILYHKKSKTPGIDYNGAVEEALCFGWIDSRSRGRDAESSYLYFARRKPKSGWSASNKERVERLLAQGLMTESGLALVEEAKQNGAWTALDSINSLRIPNDLQQALDRNPKAATYFTAFPPSAKKRILEWIRSAKREETRSRRIAETIRLAEQNESAR